MHASIVQHEILERGQFPRLRQRLCFEQMEAGPHAVDLEVCLEDTDNLGLQGDIPPCSGGKPLGIVTLGDMRVVG